MAEYTGNMASPLREAPAVGSPSPPNSVKAFAEARGLTSKETLPRDQNGDRHSLRRSTSVAARSRDGNLSRITTNDGDFLGNAYAENDSHLSRRDASTVGKRYSLISTNHWPIVHAKELDELFSPTQRDDRYFGLPSQNGAWWLHASNPSKREVEEICSAFSIHPLTVEDIVKQESREKIDIFPSYYLASFRSFNTVEEEDGRDFKAFNLYVVVFRQGTLSFSFEPNNHASRVHGRIAILDDPASVSSDWICYALIDDIVDGFAPAIRQLELETDAIEEEVFIMRDDGGSSSFLRIVGQARKNSMALLRLLGGKSDVIRNFAKHCNEDYRIKPQMNISLYLEDVQDHAVTMSNNLSHFESILSRAHHNYLATLSIIEATQGTDTNKMLIKITLFASVLVPLHLFSTAFGMNIPNPVSNVESVGSFFGILGIMVFFGIIILAVARLKRWL